MVRAVTEDGDRVDGMEQLKSRVEELESALYREGFLPPMPLPAARLGRSSHVSGGPLGRLGLWFLARISR